MEKGKISSLQMAILLYPTVVATGIISAPSITAKYTQNDLWMSPILASLLGFVTVYIAIKLHNLYPNETVIQFSEHIIGRFPGKVLGFFFLFFYIQGTGEITRAYSEFLVGSFLFQTPISVIIASMIFLCAFVVYRGIEVLGRIAQLFFPVFFVPLLILIILLSPEFDFANILPVLEGGMMPPIKGAIVLNGWYSELFLITFLLPFLADRKKGMKYGMMTVFAVMITLVMVNLAVLFVLGPTTASKVYPLMNAARYISFADFFENLESIAMAVWIVGAFVKISVFYYGSALATAQWLNLSDYRPIVWPLAILIVEFSFWSLPSTTELHRYLNLTFSFYAPFIQTMIPLLLLVMAVVRKRKKEKKT